MKFLRHRTVQVALTGLWIGGFGLMSAEEAAMLTSPSRLQPEWGTQDLGVRTIHGQGFQQRDSSTTFSYSSITSHRFRTGGSTSFSAALPDLPAGALITGLEVEGCDDNTTASVSAFLWSRESPLGPSDLVGSSLSTGNAETPGCALFGSASNLIAAGFIVNNFDTTLWVTVSLTADDATTSLGAVRIYYQLRVSPAPAVASFGDVPTTHPFFQFIEALAASGITAGCGSGNFCPDAPLKRGQMAVFLSKALGLHFPY